MAVETLLHAGLGNALAAALLAPLVAAIGIVARRPALMHALWVMVLLKLITPPLWSVPVVPGTAALAGEVGGPREPAEPLAVIARLEPPASEPVFGAGPTWEIVPPDSVWIVEAPAWSGPESPEAPIAAGTAPSWRTVAATTWIVGTLTTFGIAAVRVRKFGRLLEEARPAPWDVLDRVEVLADRLGLSAPPEVRMTPGAVSPMLWAPGCRPLLIVPDDLWKRLDGARRDTLLVHELAHLKRRDHWVRGLELLATGLYWWHPVVWWSRRALHEAEEQCCDAWVVWAIPGAGRTYAEALLDTVDFLSGAGPSVPWAASGLGHVHHLKRRLVMILNGTTPRALGRSGILATLGLCAAMLPLSPSWAQESPDAKPSETVEARVERRPAPECPREDVLKSKINSRLPDETVVDEEIVTRVHEDALKPLQAKLEELSAKGELSKQEQIRRSAIEHAIKELKRALGERGEDNDARADKPNEQGGGKGANRRVEVRVERTERQKKVDKPSTLAEDPLSDDPAYQEQRKRAAEIENEVARMNRSGRIPDDPTLKGMMEQLVFLKKDLATYREKWLGSDGKKVADFDKARAELREQGAVVSMRRAELMEAEQRFHKAVERLATMERGDRGARGPVPDGLKFRGPVPEFAPGFPFRSPGGRPGSSGNIIILAPEVRGVRSIPQEESPRISELEKKLDRVLEEVKQLKEQKPSYGPPRIPASGDSQLPAPHDQ